MAQLRLEHERVERAHRERIEELKSHLAGVIDRTTRIRTAYDKEKRQLLNQVRKRNAAVVQCLRFLYGCTCSRSLNRHIAWMIKSVLYVANCPIGVSRAVQMAVYMSTAFHVIRCSRWF